MDECTKGKDAYKKAINTKYVRLPDLLYDLDQAKGKDAYKKKLAYYAKANLLIIDEWLLNSTTSEQQADILELLELRYGYKSTIFASQFLPEGWHKNLGGGAVQTLFLTELSLIHI